MMKTNWFNFYPVGHGLFYAGSLLDYGYNFVYDCGSKQLNTAQINRYSSHFLKLCQNKKLQFIAISHFHEDHFNGIADLLNMFSVDEIIAPYISRYPIIKLAIFAALMVIDADDKAYDIERIITILNHLRETDKEWQCDENDDVRYQIRRCDDYWKFVFTSKPITKLQESNFEAEIKKVFDAHIDCENNVIELIKKGYINEIRDAYRTVFGKSRLNEASLIMFHYPTNYLSAFNNVLTINPGHLEYQLKYVFPISLLTGDITFDKSLGSFIKNMVGDNIGVIQVPHHGSNPNWKKLNSFLERISVVYLVPKGKNQKVASFNKTKKALSSTDYKIVDEESGYCYWITTTSSNGCPLIIDCNGNPIDCIYNSILK